MKPKHQGISIALGLLLATFVTTEAMALPATISDLQFGHGRTTGTLSWTAPGNSGSTGQAAAYDIRYSNSPITEQNFASCSQWTAPSPQPAGSTECIEMTLSQCTTYYWAVKTQNTCDDWSAMSNVPSGSTACSGSTQVLCP